jgi:hypothetical protein
MSGTTVYFTNLSQLSGVNSAFYWEFGDGNTSQLEDPLHTYANPGAYLVCLFLIDSTGTICDSICHEIVVGQNFICEAYFEIDWLQGYTYTFDNQSYGTVSYQWDFGDGNTSSAFEPVHTYADSGYYVVCLTAFLDSNGVVICSDTYCETIYAGSGVSIGDNPALQNVLLYPNPAADLTTLAIGVNQAGMLNYTVINPLGVVVGSYNKYLPVGNHQLTVDVAGYPAGIYLLQITMHGENIVVPLSVLRK